MSGLIHIYTGDGKGKSTAAIGLAIRCAGYGDTVVYTQFLKSGKSSELNIIKEISNIHIVEAEKSFGFLFNASDEEKAEAKEVYSKLLTDAIAKAKETNCRMLVLDEIIATYNYNFLNKDALVDFLKNKPEEMEVVMTGRNPAKELMEMADYISDIKKVKHPYDKGIPARKGIEK
ncbi:MAG: cob(I)yrinic acid a,c-diamide adenosyltransferase [Bacillota bacterium]|nr:cob(I)yrinic acid a,c-diamide adenosyltransferase [Bacillota bacterium]